MLNTVIIGTLEIITFRTTREDHPFLFPILALLYGQSTGHIALRFRINDKALFDQYVSEAPNIPHRSSKISNEFYFSFWPNNDNSQLVNYRYDCEQSATYTEFTYQPRF